MRGRPDSRITAPLRRNQKHADHAARILYEHVYTEWWHTFKRPAKKICTFFAGGAKWLYSATYAARTARFAAIELGGVRKPTLNNQLLLRRRVP
jgi:hypothetical protein